MNARTIMLALFLGALPSLADAQVPSFTHVFVIVMENHEYEDIIGSPSAPYVNALAQQYGVARSDFAVTHPSLPNYMALTAGGTFFPDDCVGCTTAAVNLFDRIEASGRTWTAYMEDMPAPCTTTDSGLYVARHNPFVHYSDIVGNAARCSNGVVPFSRFSSDLSANSLSSFVWITPNVCNDMHDCPVATGDAWLQSLVPQILQSPAFANSVLFIVWDEGTTTAGGGGHIPLIVASPMTPAGTQVGQAATHYSLLRTIEDAWGLSPLGQSASAAALSGFFPQPPTTPGTRAADIVIHAADVPATAVHGMWSAAADPTAADGVKLGTPDNGWATTSAPIAAPADYVDVTFNANANTPYTFWLRMQALNNSKWNDSVWVQFSDATAGGSAAYPLNSTSALCVNLATDSTAASDRAWGWQHGCYWLSQAATISFASSGAHTLRIQVREDGVQFDQIVLSPSTYLNAAPGLLSNDQTIVAKPNPGNPPGMAGNPSPANGAKAVSATPTLTWSAPNSTSYDVSFGTANPPPTVSTGQTSASYTPATPANGTTYFWQILARNSSGTTAGPIWSFTTATPPSSGNVVIFASDIPAGAVHGMWSFATDSTSPNGIKLGTPDIGWSTTSAPLAAPTHYVDVTFNANANTPYTLWLRVQASANSKWNDSLWVQFSDAQAGGSQVYAINTTSGLDVNLATDSTGASVSGWGWVNGVYWFTQPATISFATSGSHTLRIQVREDGVQFDQIVLSPTTYFNASASCPGTCTGAPGPVRNDATIVSK
jgi:acid phosphatase